jgi:formylglycine-generating enzyme required for sulfatase activity
MVRTALLTCSILILVFTQAGSLHAEDIARLQSGVVKITAKPPEGTPKIGTGFIVRLEGTAVYIVTAAHVVAGDPHPQVEFFTKRNVPVPAEVSPGAEGGDEIRGLALLMVKGKENIPSSLGALPLASNVRLSGGEDIILIGFPRGVGPWAVIKGNISSRQGRDIYFYPTVGEGNSGGPIIQNGKVVGLVGAGGQLIGQGVTARSIEDYIEGFGITAQETAPEKAAEAPPESTAPSKPEKPPPTAKPSPTPIAPPEREPAVAVSKAEIRARDTVPLVLIPAGEFLMGSGNGDQEEKPMHSVYVDTFYMDKFEVTIAQYEKFLRSSGRKGPRYWEEVNLDEYRDRPVIGVNWEDAHGYCEWAGKHLPTEAQWEKAARGTDGRIYPWGNGPPAAKHGNFGQCCEWKGYKSLAAVNLHEEGKSPYGVHNMVGNVREWTRDWYGAEYYAMSPRSNPLGPESGTERVIRGGSWANSGEYLQATNRDRERPDLASATIGIRCVQEAE